MIPGPIHKVLSTFLKHDVRALLIGGQACILYGAAEFSRDIDFAVTVVPGNLDRVRAALAELDAEQVYVPALSADVLRKGHACHFRCRAEDARGFRVDILSVMRGVDGFDELWARRRDIAVSGLGSVAIMGLHDLVKAKKTQRDKDWPMIRRLVEADIYSASAGPSPAQVLFWLSECRTPELLAMLAAKHPAAAARAAIGRPLVTAALQGRPAELPGLLREEEDRERELDRLYWAPLMAELAKWRRER
jgi:hypothetical protein